MSPSSLDFYHLISLSRFHFNETSRESYIEEENQYSPMSMQIVFTLPSSSSFQSSPIDVDPLSLELEGCP